MLPGMVHFTPMAAALGGLLLGVASSLLFLLEGRILGISGIVGQLPTASGDRSWRALFLAGLVTGALVLLALRPESVSVGAGPSVGLAVGAGLLVGLGTRLANGCTSGHGLCGLARLSRRSLVATLTFMAAAAVTVFLMRHVLHVGGAS
jgi:uncharacterized membrane protein YedE/YeeE